jgi:hypothetical protein
MGMENETYTAEARIEQNNARIAELKQRLEHLGAKPRISGRDQLDLSLASNRARNHDISRAMSHLDNIESRRETLLRNQREDQKAAENAAIDKDLKLSELIKDREQRLIDRSRATTAAEKASIDAVLEDNANRIRALGGEPREMKFSGLDKGDVLNRYYTLTKNTKGGRKFNDDVTASDREQLVRDLREVGDDQKADEIQATYTKQERDAAAVKEKQKKLRIKTEIENVNKSLSALAMKPRGAITDNDVALRSAFLQKADSLVRNYPGYVKFENDRLKYIAKD